MGVIASMGFYKVMISAAEHAPLSRKALGAYFKLRTPTGILDGSRSSENNSEQEKHP
jgi:hypothetical protein